MRVINPARERNVSTLGGSFFFLFLFPFPFFFSRVPDARRRDDSFRRIVPPICIECAWKHV